MSTLIVAVRGAGSKPVEFSGTSIRVSDAIRQAGFDTPDKAALLYNGNEVTSSAFVGEGLLTIVPFAKVG